MIGGDLSQGAVQDQLAEQLRTIGVAVFTGIRGPEHLLAFASGLMRVVAHPDADPSGLTTITDLGPAGWQPNAAGFSRRALPPHTDRSGAAHPPTLLLTSCASPAATGGSRRLIDGLAVYDDLATTSPQALAAFARARTTLFGGAAGYLGSVFTDVPAADGRPLRRMIRLRLDSLVRFSPEIAVWVPALAGGHRPQFAHLRPGGGQGYLVDNHRCLHAREAYEGPRVLCRSRRLEPRTRSGRLPSALAAAILCRYDAGVSAEAERTAALARWQQAVGTPDERGAAWAEDVLDRVVADQVLGADRRAS